MLEWVLGTSVSVSLFVTILLLMVLYFRRQGDSVDSALRQEIRRMTDASLAHSNGLLMATAHPLLVVTLHLRNGLAREQVADAEAKLLAVVRNLEAAGIADLGEVETTMTRGYQDTQHSLVG